MKKVILDSTPELREYMNSEMDINWSEENGKIVITYHDETDLFRIGELFGKWQSSTVRLQNYL
jgi:hypothetical protein